MKKLFFLILVLIFGKSAFCQYPVTQNLGSSSTLVQVPANGGLKSLFVNRPLADTTEANTTNLKYYPGAQFFAANDTVIWLRNSNATKWIQLFSNTSGGGGTPSDTLIWHVSGNGQTVVNSLSGGGIGTANIVPLWFITSGAIRVQLPAAGMILSNDTTSNKIMTFNPSTKNWGYSNWVGGGSSSTPTLQQVFNTEVGGSVLTKNDSILYSGFSMRHFVSGGTGYFNNGNNLFYYLGNANGTTGIRLDNTNTGAGAATGVYGYNDAGDEFVIQSTSSNYTAFGARPRTYLIHSNAAGGIQIASYRMGTGITFGVGGSVSSNLDSTRTAGVINGYTGNWIFKSGQFYPTDLGYKVQVIGDTYLSDSLTLASVTAGASTDSLLTINPSTGLVRKIDPLRVATNIYNSDGTLTGDRTVTANGNDLIFSGSSDIVLNATNGTSTSQIEAIPTKAILASLRNPQQSTIEVFPDSISIKPGQSKIYIDSLTQGLSTDSLLSWQPSTGLVRKIDPARIGGNTIYTGNGVIPGGANRIVDFTGAQLNFTGGIFNFVGTNNSLVTTSGANTAVIGLDGTQVGISATNGGTNASELYATGDSLIHKGQDGQSFYTSGVNRMTIANNGNTTIGTGAVGGYLFSVGSTAYPDGNINVQDSIMGFGDPVFDVNGTAITIDDRVGQGAILYNAYGVGHTFQGNVGIGTTPGTTTLSVAGSLALGYVEKTTTYVVAASDYTINCTSGTFTVTLPTAVGITGRVYVIKNTGAGTVTIDGDGTETIDGSLTQALNIQYASLTVQSTGTGWIIL